MKFVCENCKAKYQIGDDKVAGKTLRMKCRRCGHMIQVSATVTETSVSKLNPAMPGARAEIHVGAESSAAEGGGMASLVMTGEYRATEMLNESTDEEGATVV